MDLEEFGEEDLVLWRCAWSIVASGVGVGQMRHFGMTKCVLGVVSVDLEVTKCVLMLIGFRVVWACVCVIGDLVATKWHLMATKCDEVMFV